ncbi:hypothetical protein M0811_08194 [Anaeramoeba ignava]|uniref:Amino acid transporter transmembrane domain-containing protein n=1 Tax=Anaeramoeba ignava TaxID=1746090 RepID=A0A9Q0LJR1_ANAIG|nr:hypothetical protein M0811_08194 [Anaeramoeba ignava]
MDIQNSQQKPKKMFGSFIGYVFMINYILGVGILEIPYSFEASGLLLSAIFLLVVTFFSSTTMMYVVEVEGRAEGIVSYFEEKKQEQNLPQNPNNLSESNDSDNNQQDPIEDQTQNLIFDEKEISRFEIKNRKFEVNEMCNLFLGKFGKRFFTFASTCYLYGALWSYASVFSTSLIRILPLTFLTHGDLCEIDGKLTSGCQYNYYLYMVLFALISIPLSCLDLSEQIIVQTALFIFRLFSLLLILVTTIIAMHTVKKDNHPDKPPYIGTKKLFDFKGVAYIFTNAIFSQLVHHSTTIIAEPVKKKRKLRVIFNSAFLTTYFFYSTLGIVCAMYFGENVLSVISLNWIELELFKSATTWRYIVEYCVVIFPVIEVLSAFPLHAITLGNNMYFAVYPVQKDPIPFDKLMKEQEKTEKKEEPEQQEDQRRDTRDEMIADEDLTLLPYHKKKGSKKKKILFRLIASIPPIIGACLIRKLPDIIIMNGTFGCFIAYLIPSLLAWKSKKIAQQIFGKSKTPYSNWLSNDIFIWISFGFGVFSFFVIWIIILINFLS